jgi:hypothetical protein
MSPATKQKAIDKLNTMTFKNVWPDYWFTDKESRYVRIIKSSPQPTAAHCIPTLRSLIEPGGSESCPAGTAGGQ